MSQKTKSIALTQNIQVNEGSHILYFYESEEKYIENLSSFILTAKSMNQHVIIIESYTRYAAVLERLGEDLTELELEEILHYKNNTEFYNLHGDFIFERSLENFKRTVQPFVDEQLAVRIWGEVSWTDHKESREKLHRYECEADMTLSEIGYVTVCCYNGNEIPASVQTNLMRSHPYFMTDTDLVKSSLYNHNGLTVFPSCLPKKRSNLS